MILLHRMVLPILIAIYFLVTYFEAAGQADRPPLLTVAEVDKPCPLFVLSDLKYYSKNEVTPESFKGKWTILDFWTKYCTSCVASFPAINEMQKKYKDQVQFVLIGRQDAENQLEDIYHKFREKYKLELPVAFDSNIFNRFNIGPVPYILVIDKEGIVRRITSKVTDSGLANLLSGKPAEFRQTGDEETLAKQMQSVIWDPVWVDANGLHDSDFRYLSMLAHWHPSKGFRTGSFMNPIYRNHVLFRGMPLQMLFRVAYADTLEPTLFGATPNNVYNDFWYWPILEMKDTSQFIWDVASGKNLFNYSLIVPREKASAKYLKECMQRDLNSYFGYSVVVEERSMPYYKLIATSKAKSELKSKRGPSMEELGLPYSSPVHFELRNRPVSAVINNLAAHFQIGPPFVDETGITGNIDIKVEAILQDLEEVRRGLQKNGLDLVLGRKKMKVIVIKDLQ